MSETRLPERCSRRRRPLQHGAAAIEFALIVIVFFAFIFAIIELARLLYAYNTLQDSTRRAASAASTSAFGNAAEMDKIRQKAVFRTSSGILPLMPEVSDESVRIDYLWLQRGADAAFSMQPVAQALLPASAAQNNANCLADPYSPTCVQLVRARICDPQNTSDCIPIKFRTLTTIVRLEVPLPTAPTIVKAQSLGFIPN